jgi:hypothetical protein
MVNIVVETIADGYRAVHQQLRDHLSGAEEAALVWVPAPETNPVSVLVIHALGSEAEVWRLAASTTGSRDRAAEFIPQSVSKQDLLARLAAADALLGELAPKVTQQDLEALRERPDRAPQTALHWLITNYGHAREHLAHVELTLQLYREKGT